MKMTGFWDTETCSLVEVGRRFRGLFYLLMCLFVVYLTTLFLVIHTIWSRAKKWWIWKILEESGRGIISSIIPAFASRDWGKPQNLSTDSLPPGRYLNTGPLEYKARVLTTRPWRSSNVSKMCTTSIFTGNNQTAHLWNVGLLQQDYMTLYLIRLSNIFRRVNISLQNSSAEVPWQRQ
jgi:hypothetical protein